MRSLLFLIVVISTCLSCSKGTEVVSTGLCVAPPFTEEELSDYYNLVLERDYLYNLGQSCTELRYQERIPTPTTLDTTPIDIVWRIDTDIQSYEVDFAQNRHLSIPRKETVLSMQISLNGNWTVLKTNHWIVRQSFDDPGEFSLKLYIEDLEQAIYYVKQCDYHCLDVIIVDD